MLNSMFQARDDAINLGQESFCKNCDSHGSRKKEKGRKKKVTEKLASKMADWQNGFLLNASRPYP